MKFSEFQFKMLFGFILLIAVLTLAVMVARESQVLQNVNNTDLQQVLTILAVLAGGFAQWAFSRGTNGTKPPT